METARGERLETSAKGKPFIAREKQNPERNVQPSESSGRNSDNSEENRIYQIGSSSEQERKVNALASGADEGRDKLR